MRRPLALTQGEPAGIGLDITAVAWEALRGSGPVFVLIGDAGYAAARAARIGIDMPVTRISNPEEAFAVFSRALPVMNQLLPRQPSPGSIEPNCAKAVVAAIDTAVDLAVAGRIGGMVTNPIQKETLYAAGFEHQGHTDYLAHLAQRRGLPAEPVMMLATKGLRTVPVTVHIALKDVPAALTRAAIETQARVVARDLAKFFAIPRPRLGVTGLNPHAGEGGAMGTEEQQVIAPAIAALRRGGLAIEGPLPGDTAFHEEARARFDAILCMYHDQALIPVKTLDFHGGINITLGLPFIRTSPDHGTALSLAGCGKAKPTSLIAAIKTAAAMAAAHAG